MLQILIDKKLSTVDLKELSHLLGYRATGKFKQRLTEVIRDKHLGLDHGYYDLLYGSEEFVRQLCNRLAIPSLLVNDVIAEIKIELEKKKLAATRFIFIDTNFRRQSQPIFTLAVMEQQRYLTIDDDIAIMPLNQQLEMIQAKVRTHYQQHPVLDFWGPIQRYAYFYQQAIIIVLSTTGEIEEVTTKYPRSMATLRLKE